MNYGWNKKLLKIDLSNQRVNIDSLDENILKLYLGGRGLNVKFLYELTDEYTNPLGPDNPLIISSGPITGTIAPASCRHNITSKSPLTGILGDSNSAGFFGAELKYAGFDQIIITGKSKKPVYLKIFNDDIEICNAEDIWGKNVWETDRILKRKLGDNDFQIAAIGQAGENLVKIAGIMNNLSRAAARTGMGAVMGSKNLKAIAVKGTKGVSIAYPERFYKIVKKILNTIYNSPHWEARSNYGTTMLILLKNNILGTLPYRNSQGLYYKDAYKIGHEVLYNKYVTQIKSCFSCPVHCSRFYQINNGPFSGVKGEGPEYETLVSLGSRCDNSNLESILFLNNLCNQYGLDTISAGTIISFAMECYVNGLISKKDTDGLDLSWGNYKAIMKLIHNIAFRKGFGNLLAEGVKKASENIPGSNYYALHVKGLEVSAQGVRGEKAWGLGWAVSSRGADHLRAFPVAETLLTKEEAKEFFNSSEEINRFSYSGKARLVKWSEEFSAITDCLELCKIVAMPLKISIDDIAVLLSSTTGVEFTTGELLKIGERVVNLERLYNKRLGLNRKDDRVPDRFREEPVPEGNSKGETLDVDKMLPEYYKLRGWDKKGNPSRKKLNELGLSKI